MSSAWSSARAGRAPPSSPHRPTERAPQVGDLICASRGGSGTTLDNLNRGAGHCDIVVEVRPGEVARHRRQRGQLGQPQRLSTGRQSGFYRPYPARPFFTVIENRLP